MQPTDVQPADAENRPLVIGVDGGGTKTEAVLAGVEADGGLRVLHRCTTGPSNLQLASFDAIANEVRGAVEGLFADHPEWRRRVQAICFCMAGAGNETLRQRFEGWAHAERLAPQIQVTHDARCLIAAGTRRGVGVALIAGTGSLAYARNAAGHQSRCGGWGSLFGDEGSSYWLALAAFRAASQALDGRGTPTQLVAALSEWLECGRPEQWLVKLRTLESHAIASAARIVSRLAESGDTVARRLLEQCAEQLSLMLVTLAHRCFPNEPIDLALAGGLILHNETLREAVLRRTGDAGIRIEHCQQVAHPVDGAVRLAAESLRDLHPTLD
ncbi:N-acetylglucosamine kinase [Candidatus Laterigemmans baculatus]|uniref:N-acetylglucosamine kinase n=1 Tax=Candidatus Laterigemmans baculatus TaxID=2770505 RepID=UPI0013DD6F13|nr:BadF/BadG/BcrA/BcrD ATPase family protein [Candidatus Laterigemmans baculatus]